MHQSGTFPPDHRKPLSLGDRWKHMHFLSYQGILRLCPRAVLQPPQIFVISFKLTSHWDWISSGYQQNPRLFISSHNCRHVNSYQFRSFTVFPLLWLAFQQRVFTQTRPVLLSEVDRLAPWRSCFTAVERRFQHQRSINVVMPLCEGGDWRDGLLRRCRAAASRKGVIWHGKIRKEVYTPPIYYIQHWYQGQIHCGKDRNKEEGGKRSAGADFTSENTARGVN